jgi:hypothetical protein
MSVLKENLRSFSDFINKSAWLLLMIVLKRIRTVYFKMVKIKYSKSIERIKRTFVGVFNEY